MRGLKGPHHADRREPLGRPDNKIPVWPDRENVFILLGKKLFVRNKWWIKIICFLIPVLQLFWYTLRDFVKKSKSFSWYTKLFRILKNIWQGRLAVHVENLLLPSFLQWRSQGGAKGPWPPPKMESQGAKLSFGPPHSRYIRFFFQMY